MQGQRTARWTAIGIGIGLVVVLAGCGGQAADAPATEAASIAPDSPASEAPGTAPDVPASEAASTAPDDPAPPPAGASNTAVVIIGEERYEFSDVQCSIFAPRYIQAGNFGGDPEVSIVLPPEGWESEGDTYSPPSVRVQVGDDVTGQRWVAGDDGSPLLSPIAEGSSQIDSYTVPDGRPVTATGTATFTDVMAHNNGADAPPVSGSFEVSCP
jgi:hypothetical protein